MSYTRPITHRYTDPLDLIWLACAEACGYTIARSQEVYASFDGARTITLSTPDDFDPDDSLAQMILHELCHMWVSGERRTQPDWGMDNTTDADLLDEYATHRLQAALADRWGLRPLFAVTTMWRPYWDALGPRPLEARGPGPHDPAIARALDALTRADAEPYASALRQAFAQTVRLADLTRPLAPSDSLWAACDERVHRRHRLGELLGPRNERCGTCAWGVQQQCERARLRGQEDAPVSADEAACLGWEPILDEAACIACGACCRQAFDLVGVEADEAICQSHPELISPAQPGRYHDTPFHIARPEGFCRALARHEAPYLCQVYEMRPQSCRDFTLGSANCLEARQRVRVSPR